MAGRGIHDKGGWPASSDQSMKSKTHLKEYHSANGDGAVKDYPDTTEHIKRDQDMGVSKAKSQPMKSGYRY